MLKASFADDVDISHLGCSSGPRGYQRRMYKRGLLYDTNMGPRNLTPHFY